MSFPGTVMSKLYIVRSGAPPTAAASRYLFVESIPMDCTVVPLKYGDPLNGVRDNPNTVVDGTIV
jgi:hypothetical protein